METKEKVNFQIKSILIVRYITEFAILEKKVLSVFRKEILSVEHAKKNKIFFYYGALLGHDISYDFDANKIALASNHGYDENDAFNSLNFNKIIKLDSREHLIKAFDFSIDSVIRESLTFPFHSCCQKLICMRNKLAHEMDKITFNDRDIIETLSMEYFLKNTYSYLEEYDISNMDDISTGILSNIVYIKNLQENLETHNTIELSI